MGNVNVIHEGVAKTICAMCHNHCGIDVHLRGNTIIKLKPTQEDIKQRLCVKAAAITDYEYSNQRLIYPLRKINGSLKRVSWDEALNFIATKLNYIKAKYGPQSLAMYYGNGTIIQQAPGLMRLWAEAYGTPNICDVGCVCFWSEMAADLVTFGWQERPSLAGTKCILNWGFNSYHVLPPARHIWSHLKELGIKAIVIDPRLTYEAKMADLYLRPRVGTDWALALGFINVIIAEELYDKNFVDKWTIGFDKLAKVVADDYTPEKVAEVTSVPADLIRAAAKMYATTKPATISFGQPLNVTTHGFQVHRTRAILMAITGNFAVEGSNQIIQAPASKLLKFPREDYEYHKNHKPTFTADRYPLFEQIHHQPVGSLLADTILTGNPYPIKGFICQGGNPLGAYPDANKFKKALEELDFVAVMDVFMTELAELADIVLPAATFLERDWATIDIGAGHKAGVAIVRKVLEPIGECWSDTKFWLELAKLMGYEKALPWKDDEEVLEAICQAEGKTLKEIEEGTQGFHGSRGYKSYKGDTLGKKGFPTPSGKVEIYSERLEKMGITPIPVPYEEPCESPVTKPDLFKEYPLTGLSGVRKEAFTHTQGRTLPALRSRCPDPLFDINPKDAEKYGINNGEWAIIESPRGKIIMKANISEDIMEGLISMPHGWAGECNVNYLTSTDLGLEAGDALLKGFACRVRKND
jgi:anaerobic selenocysteine-containing dehydrogenase